MKLPQPSSRRGQPLFALGFLMLTWIGVRTVVLASDDSPGYDATPSAAAHAVPPAPRAAEATPARPDQVRPAERPAFPGVLRPQVQVRLAEPQDAPIVAAPLPQTAPSTVAEPAALPDRPLPVPPRIAAGHQLLMMAGLSELPMPAEALAATPPPVPLRAPVPFLPAARNEAIRWSADGWMLWRPGGNGDNLPGAGLPGANLPSGAYGASQAGMVVRYRLAPSSPLRPALYLRASTGLHYPRGEELAAGIALRPVPRIPVAAMAEARVTRTPSGNIVRPALAVVSELAPVALPFALRAEVYGQAGWVGGKDHTPFIDGQARIERPLARAGTVELRVGAGAWGGAQRGTGRLDVGPTATLDVPLGPVGSRVSADYRFRLVGNAAPGSGPAVTLSAGF
ncbi:MAG: hypothetical protein ACKOPG_01025 [Novosphingobium sp.]